MNTIWHYLQMGNYAIYVWPVYGLAALVLIVSWLGIRRQKHQTRKLLQQWFGQA